MAHDCVSARHALYTYGKHRRDDRRQSFRNRGDGKRNAEYENFDDPRKSAYVLNEDDGHDHDHRDDDDDETEHFAGAIELPLQRRLLSHRLPQKTGDVSHLGLHPCRGNDCRPSPVRRRRCH